MHSSAILALQADASHDKIINDTVHGYMRFSKQIMQLVDTPEFQRLRDLNQLGVCYYVFPGGSHHRFEHCLGVCYLAGIWMRKFQSEQPELGITDRDVFIVQTAALCHDLGHGPFSHVWDNEFVPRVHPDIKWSHEDMSEMIFEHMALAEENKNLGFTEDEIKLVKALIRGKDNDYPGGRKFLFMIVANNKNGIDVDKFDYLARDGRNLNVPEQFHASRLLTLSRVIDDEICFKSSEVDNIYDMFNTRYKLHKKIYSHRVAKAIEYMITDALVIADKVFHFSNAIDQVERYLSLTDSILKKIEYHDDRDLTEEEQAHLREAKSIIQRVRRRQLYKFVDEVLAPKEFTSTVTVDDILKSSEEHTDLTASDLIVQNMKINYALKEKNPVDHCHFYQESNPNKKFKIEKDKVSLLIPGVFQERYIRLFVRDENKLDEAIRVFRRWAKVQELQVGGEASPFSKRKSRGVRTSGPAKRALVFDE